MKRIACFVLALVFLCGGIPLRTNATERKCETIHFEDGSYMIVEVHMNQARASGYITGSKPATYYDSLGNAQWKVILTGNFHYTDSGATCTDSSVSVEIYDSSWYTISKYATKNGNKATASVTMGDKPAGQLVSTVPVSLSLSCDANGNLS